MSENIREETPVARTVYTAAQIMALQTQVKAFKELSAKYSELEISKVIDHGVSRQLVAPGVQSAVSGSGASAQHASASTGALSSAPSGVPSKVSVGPSRVVPPAIVLPVQSTHASRAVVPSQANAPKVAQATTDSTIPSTIPSIIPTGLRIPHQTSTIPQRSQPAVGQLSSAPIAHAPSSTAPVTTTSTDGTATLKPAVAAVPKPLTAPAQTSTSTNPSWQCFGSLLFSAPNATDSRSKANDNADTLSVSHHNVAPFLKSNSTSSTFTHPYAVSLRERLVFIALSHGDSTSVKVDGDSSRSRAVDLLVKQRLARAQLASHFRAIELVDKPHVLNGRKNAAKERKKSKRDVRAQEKEMLRHKQGLEEQRKKRQSDFLRMLLGHRDDFLKFHKDRRMDYTRTARLARQKVEGRGAKKGKEEVKSEQLRLQALKQNDMEAYSKLVDETKNERLRFLLSETDSFIQGIQDKIEDQRALGAKDEEMRASEEAALKGTSLMGTTAVSSVIVKTSAPRRSDSSAAVGLASKGYLEQTHRLTEKVMQPRMLKGGQLKEYQLEGLRWMVSLYNNNLNGILADEMGLGKTIQAISLLAYLIEFKANKGPFMIVVPLSTLSNWVNECSKWAPAIIKVVYRGSPVIRRAIYKDEIEHGRFNVLITTYEYIMRDKSALKRIKWQYVIVDEGHRMKNANSKFAQILGNQYHSKHRILLTGTPLQNNLPELWALLNFLLPYIFGSMESFDQWFNQPFAAFQASRREANSDQGDNNMAQLTQEERLLVVHRLHEVLRPFMLRRVKSQVLDQLPDKVENVIRCRLSGWQRKLYRIIQERGRSADGETVNRGGINNILMQLRKVCNHPYLFLSEWYADDDLIRSSGKFELLDRMLPKLKTGGHRVLMFSQMTHAMTLLERFFDLKGFSYLRLDGSTSAEEREKFMFMFNEPESPYFIFLLSTRAGGLGLNLASADTVFIFDSDWNPMMDMQAQDRAHRIGQKNEVHVFRIVTTTAVEEKIMSRAAEKMSLNGLVVEAGEFNMKAGASSTSFGEVNDDRREMMEALMREWSGEGVDAETDAENAVPDDDQINEMMASCEGEVELYRLMDVEREEQQRQAWRREAGDDSEPPPRLMEANKPPSWLTSQHWTSTNASLVAPMMNLANDGLQKKKKVAKSQDFYDDIDGEGSMEGAEGDGEEEGESVHTTEVASRKRSKIKYVDDMTDNQFEKYLENGGDIVNEPSFKRQRTSEEFSPEVQVAIHKIIKKVVKTKKADGSGMVELFLKKPDKKLFPDYYDYIKEPISIKEITDKLKKSLYNSIDEVDLDFQLMCSNARTYNIDGSVVVLAAEEIMHMFVASTNDFRL